jgi:probable biosynthetic protein (TIGR04098 family)
VNGAGPAAIFPARRSRAVEPHFPLSDGTLPASESTLLLEPRHTGVNHLNEFLFLMHMGALQWGEIARRAGRRLRDLHSEDGQPVYASFYYVQERFSPQRPMSSYCIDDLLTIWSGVRLCGRTAIDGWHALFAEDQIPAPSSPPAEGLAVGAAAPAWVRMSNVFVKMRCGPQDLEVTLPENLAPERFCDGPACLDSYRLVKEVRAQGRFPAPPDRPLTPLGDGARQVIDINPDRDINGVRLVYFANYVTFLDAAERTLLRTALPSPDRESRIDGRTLVEREIAYYGNAAGDDRLEVEVNAHALLPAAADPPASTLVHFDYRVHRCSDRRLICLSSALKLLPNR